MYGNTDQVNQQVRQYQGGRLRVDVRNGQQWPPPSNNASGTCDIQSPTEPCYLAGILHTTVAVLTGDSRNKSYRRRSC